MMTWCPVGCWVSCKEHVLQHHCSFWNRISSPSIWMTPPELLMEPVESWWITAVRTEHTFRCVCLLRTYNTCLIGCPFLPTCTRLRRCWWEFEHHGRCSRSPLRRPQIEARRTRSNGHPDPICSRDFRASFHEEYAWACWSRGWTGAVSRDRLVKLPCSREDPMSNLCSLLFSHTSRCRWHRKDPWISQEDDDSPSQIEWGHGEPHRKRFWGQARSPQDSENGV